MAKFHVNKKGLLAQCRATKSVCPLGGESEHIEADNATSASIMYMKNMEVNEDTFPALSKLVKNVNKDYGENTTLREDRIFLNKALEVSNQDENFDEDLEGALKDWDESTPLYTDWLINEATDEEIKAIAKDPVGIDDPHIILTFKQHILDYEEFKSVSNTPYGGNYEEIYESPYFRQAFEEYNSQTEGEILDRIEKGNLGDLELLSYYMSSNDNVYRTLIEKNPSKVKNLYFFDLNRDDEDSLIRLMGTPNVYSNISGYVNTKWLSPRVQSVIVKNAKKFNFDELVEDTNIPLKVRKLLIENPHVNDINDFSSFQKNTLMLLSMSKVITPKKLERLQKALDES